MKLNLLANQIYVVAINEARIQGHEYLTPEHFLYAVLMFEGGREIIEYSGGSIPDMKRDLMDFFYEFMPKSKNSSPSDSVEFVKMLELAAATAHGSGINVISASDLVAAMFNLHESFAAYIMLKNGVSRFSVLRFISQERNRVEQQEAPAPNTKEREELFLSQFTVNLTDKAKRKGLDPLIGREEIIERTIQVLCRRLKNNPIHVGDPGVGKTAIVEGIAQLIAEGCVPGLLAETNIFHIDMGTVLAGTKYRGDFEERLIKLLEIISRTKNPIVYIDEIHTVVGAGAVSGGGMDATGILKPYLAKGELRFIGSTTYEEYKKYFEKDRALVRRFQRIDVPEPSAQDSVMILKGLRTRYEEYHNVIYTDEIVTRICSLTGKHMHDRFLPDKAIDVMDETGAFARMSETIGCTRVITEKDIERTVALMAKIPEDSISGSEIERLKNLSSNIKARVFGQDEAVERVVDAIKLSRSGLAEGEKPVASLLFVGPTGVGKTEIAKQLSEHLGISLQRFDMSEYQEKHAVARLIGSPPGYVGYEEGGLLTEVIRKTPHCVLLLDEIEKAHGDILNVLLQIMDYGRLTDTMGKKADFRNVIIIMTSNAGAKELNKRVIGFEDKTMSSYAIEKEVERVFSPEFRNRLDATVLFNQIDRRMSLLIAKKELDKLSRRLQEKNITLKVTKAAIEYIAGKGLSEAYGAREIIRVVDQDIRKKLVEAVLFGNLKDGGTAVVEYKEGELKLRGAAKK